MKTLGLLVLMTAIVGLGCVTEQTTVAEPGAGEVSARLLLPRGDEVPNWEASGMPRVFAGTKLYDYIDGAGEIFLRYDFREVATTEYEHKTTGDFLAIDVYDMGSPSEAFGIYSYSRYPGAEMVEVGNEGFATQTSLDFWEGRFYVKVQAFQTGEETKRAMREFAGAIAERIPSAVWEPPAVLALLPQEGRIPRSEKFFHDKLILDNLVFISEDNTFELGKKTHCAWGEYDTEEGRGRALFVAYDSDDRAKEVASRLAAEREIPDGKKSGVWVLTGVELGRERVMLLYFRKVLGIVWGGGDRFREKVSLDFVSRVSQAKLGESLRLAELFGL